MLDVTDIQLDEASQGKPVRLMDSGRRTEFVLLRADQFDQLQRALPAEIEAGYTLLSELAPEDWDDLASYQKEVDP